MSISAARQPRAGAESAAAVAVVTDRHASGLNPRSPPTGSSRNAVHHPAHAHLFRSRRHWFPRGRPLSKEESHRRTDLDSNAAGFGRLVENKLVSDQAPHRSPPLIHSDHVSISGNRFSCPGKHNGPSPADLSVRTLPSTCPAQLFAENLEYASPPLLVLLLSAFCSNASDGPRCVCAGPDRFVPHSRHSPLYFGRLAGSFHAVSGASITWTNPSGGSAYNQRNIQPFPD